MPRLSPTVPSRVSSAMATALISSSRSRLPDTKDLRFGKGLSATSAKHASR